jgi:hypothetical protein
LANVLENRYVMTRIRLDSKERYYSCRIMRISYIDRTTYSGKHKIATSQRYFFVDVELTDRELPAKARGHRIITHIPMERIHHTSYKLLVHYAFEQEDLDLAEVHGTSIQLVGQQNGKEAT